MFKLSLSLLLQNIANAHTHMPAVFKKSGVEFIVDISGDGWEKLQTGTARLRIPEAGFRIPGGYSVRVVLRAFVPALVKCLKFQKPN